MFAGKLPDILINFGCGVVLALLGLLLDRARKEGNGSAAAPAQQPVTHKHVVEVAVSIRERQPGASGVEPAIMLGIMAASIMYLRSQELVLDAGFTGALFFPPVTLSTMRWRPSTARLTACPGFPR